MMKDYNELVNGLLILKKYIKEDTIEPTVQTMGDSIEIHVDESIEKDTDDYKKLRDLGWWHDLDIDGRPVIWYYP